jgi:WD40 repeat protein
VGSLTWPREQVYAADYLARFSPDGRRIFTMPISGRGGGGIGDDPRYPAIWEADRGQFLSSLRRDESKVPSNARGTTELAISPDGQRLAIGYRDGLVRLLSSTGTPLKALSGHTSAVSALAFTPDGRRLVSASDDGTARVWDTRIGAEADFARGRWPDVAQVVFSPDGRIVAAMSGSPRPVIAYRDAASGRELARTEPLAPPERKINYGPLHPPLFSPDGRALLVNPFTEVLILFDTASGRRVWTIERMTKRSFGLAFSPDGRTVAIADGDGHLVEAATGRERLQLAGFPHQGLDETYHTIHDLRFSPDGKKVVTLNSSPGLWMASDGNIDACLWDARDGRRLAVLKEPNASGLVYGAVFSPDGRRLAIASSDHTARIWDLATGRVRVVLRGHGGSVHSVAFAADGRHIVTASDDGTARIWDAGRGRELARLEGHEGPVRSAAFSPDGAVILTSGDDRTVRLWDGGDGRPLCTLVRHDQGIGSAGFSPDGRTVFISFWGEPAASGSLSFLTRTWPVDFLSAARARCPRELTPAERTRFELTGP